MAKLGPQFSPEKYPGKQSPSVPIDLNCPNHMCNFIRPKCNKDDLSSASCRFVTRHALFLGSLSPYLTAFKPVEFSFKGKNKKPGTIAAFNYKITAISLSATDPWDRGKNSKFCLDRVALFNQHKYFHRKISQ